MNGETTYSFEYVNVESLYKNERVKWQVGKDYAVQQGRGKPSVGRIKITSIRGERLQSIQGDQAILEGVYREVVGIDEYGSERAFYSHGLWAQMYFNPIDAYRALWDSIHTKTGETWADNPLVWVLEFELVKGRG